jgi:hypothetical protein
MTITTHTPNRTHIFALQAAIERRRSLNKPLPVTINSEPTCIDLEKKPSYSGNLIEQLNPRPVKPPSTVTFLTGGGVLRTLPTQQCPPPTYDGTTVTLPIANSKTVTLPVIDGCVIGLKIPFTLLP